MYDRPSDVCTCGYRSRNQRRRLTRRKLRATRVLPLQHVYHGTSPSGAKALLSAQTFDPRQTQRRDEGFFGEGFYVTTSPEYAAAYGSVVLRFELTRSTRILVSLESSGRGSLVPDGRQSWHDDFERWLRRQIANGPFPDRVEDIVQSFDPESDRFDRLRWYKDVTKWARQEGYDGIDWKGEIILFNPSAVESIERMNHRNSTRRHYSMDLDDIREEAAIWDDPALELAIQNPRAWTMEERSGDLIHADGAKVVITGRHGRFVPVKPNGNALKGRGGGARYFKRRSDAIEALRDAGHI